MTHPYIDDSHKLLVSVWLYYASCSGSLLVRICMYLHTKYYVLPINIYLYIDNRHKSSESTNKTVFNIDLPVIWYVMIITAY